MIRAHGVLLLALLLLPSVADATIINTLRGFESDALGWSGSLEASFSLTGGNAEVRSLGGGARAQWQGDRDRWRLLASVDRTTSQGERLSEAEMAHLRHNRVLRPWVSTVSFVQWQRNPFQRLRSRLLVGLGGRFDVAKTERSEIAVGLAHMLEVERIEGIEGRETEQRLSTFLALHHQLRDGIELDATVFVQPEWTDFNDLRGSGQGSIRVDLGAGFELLMGAHWQYDARPPESVEKTDWSFETGLGYELGRAAGP